MQPSIFTNDEFTRYYTAAIDALCEIARSYFFLGRLGDALHVLRISLHMIEAGEVAQKDHPPSTTDRRIGSGSAGRSLHLEFARPGPLQRDHGSHREEWCPSFRRARSGEIRGSPRLSTTGSGPPGGTARYPRDQRITLLHRPGVSVLAAA